MKKEDWQFSGVLSLLALFIWLRDLSWASGAADTLPILVALPLMYWLSAPWEFKEKWIPPRAPFIATATLLFLVGIVTNLTLLLAIGWVILLYAWLSKRLESPPRHTLLKLLILPLMAFPWVTLDAISISWWFRLSGATVTAGLFSLLGNEVAQEGTFLVINSLPISIEAACAGLNTLQAMLIAGTAVAFILLGHTNRYWWNLPALVAIAWIANTLRIIVITTAALVVNPDFALGAFHTWGGWLVIAIMFALCWLLFSIQEDAPETKKELP